MKKQGILLLTLSLACLVGCTSGGKSNSSPEGSGGGSSSQGGGQSSSSVVKNEGLIKIDDYGVAKLEAELFDYSDWEPDSTFAGPVVQESKASGGAYLAGAARSSEGTCTFKFELAKYSKVVFSAAYAQSEDWLDFEIQMDKTYAYSIENVSPFTNTSKKVLGTRTSATAFEVMAYEPQELYPGTYVVTLSVVDNTPAGCPSIDYVTFETSDPNETIVDPSTITEVPDNDFHNLQQYKYLMDKDVTKYKTYANGQDLSAPGSLKLRFDDVADASKYYVQVSENQNFSGAKTYETTSKVYELVNGKLSTTYYYKAATSEAGLASAQVKSLTSTDLAPRVINCPKVLNFRDIGGWKSSLVPGAKIKQGLYYRCAQLNQSGYSSTRSEITADGLKVIEELGIKVDIDMRDSNNVPSSSPANTSTWSMKLVKASVPSGSEPVRWEGGSYSGTNIAAQYKTIFEALANCDNEPALLHCTYGADRTGIATFFLEALLGVSEEEMTRDYLWTQFTQGRTVKYSESDAEFPKWIEKTNACQGDTFADKMENHLMEFGIAKSTLEHIREIFVPGYVAQA